MTKVNELQSLIEPVAEALGYALVRVRLSASRRPVLQVMAERADGFMEVEDCARLSRAISALFDEVDPIESEYSLEVSSPGIDRPLTRRRDYESFAGHEARIELKTPLEGRKRIKGMLKGLKGEDVLIETRVDAQDDPIVLPVPFTLIGDAKLVLTDALIAEDLKRRKVADKAAMKTETKNGH
ncbi:MAG: ribosome maturation factor RimP [Alphaproteobacteria bacterium]|nr:ribosome maturation factor RimP [Alphaproteobacteria bacterium]